MKTKPARQISPCPRAVSRLRALKARLRGGRKPPWRHYAIQLLQPQKVPQWVKTKPTRQISPCPRAVSRLRALKARLRGDSTPSSFCSRKRIPRRVKNQTRAPNRALPAGGFPPSRAESPPSRQLPAMATLRHPAFAAAKGSAVGENQTRAPNLTLPSGDFPPLRAESPPSRRQYAITLFHPQKVPQRVKTKPARQIAPCLRAVSRLRALKARLRGNFSPWRQYAITLFHPQKDSAAGEKPNPRAKSRPTRGRFPAFAR